MTWRDLKNDERYEMRIAWGLGGPLGASPIVFVALPDPPGMSVVPRTLRQGSVEQQVWCFTPAVDVAPEWSWSVEEAQARAAAWAWYDRRLAVTEKLDRARSDAEAHRGVELRSRPLPPHHWPRCLTWPDVQVAEVDRWLVDSAAEMPEVLRG